MVDAGTPGAQHAPCVKSQNLQWLLSACSTVRPTQHLGWVKSAFHSTVCKLTRLGMAMELHVHGCRLPLFHCVLHIHATEAFHTWALAVYTHLH